MSWGNGKVSDLGVRQANSVGAVPGATRILLGKNATTGKSVVKPKPSRTSRVSEVVRQSIGDPNAAAWAYLPGLAQHAGLEPTPQPKTQLIERLMPNQVRYAKGYRERQLTGASNMKRNKRPDLGTNMDRLVDLYSMRLRAMIGEPSDKTRAAFYRTAQDILATGNSLPVDALAVQHGITRDTVLSGLVQRGYMIAHRGPSPLQVRAQRAVNWFTAKSSVPAAFVRRGNPAAQMEDCRSVICPDAGPDDPCEECEEMAEKNQRQIMAHRAIVIKANHGNGGIPARRDGNPVRYNSLGQRIA